MRKIIKAGGLLDVENETIIENAFIGVENDRICGVGTQDELGSCDHEAEEIDLEDAYLLPGLINSHAHLFLPGDGTPKAEYIAQSPQMLLLKAARNAGIVLSAGITTIRDCGDRSGQIFEIRRAIDMGVIAGPRIVASGIPLTITGGHAFTLAGEVDGPDAVVRASRLRFKQGADFIKIMATGGGTPGTYPEYAAFSVPELSSAVETAHRIGKKVAAHCRGIPGIRNAVAAGIDHIEHACFELPGGVLKFDRELADKIAAAGLTVTPTIQLYRDLVEDMTPKSAEGPLTSDQERTLDSIRRCVEEKMRSLQGLLDAGVTIIAGDDAGLPLTRFDAFWKELDAMAAGGMSAMQTIVAATRTAAETMGIEALVGSLAVGKQADLIAVKGDPLSDLGKLATPCLVMKAGKVCCRHTNAQNGCHHG